MSFPLPPSDQPGWPLLIERVGLALRGLGLSPTKARIEDVAVRIFTAMGGERRRFHNLEHLFSFRIFDPVEQIAVLFHDVVYWPVDGAWPRGFDEALGRIASSGGKGGSLAESSDLPYYREMLSIFGLEPGAEIPRTGGNELLSALAFDALLGEELGRDTSLAVAACIEATIPFRGPEARTTLHGRLLSLGVPVGQADEWLRRAVRLANEDLENFRSEDVGRFLGGTWKLLPELNPALALTGIYTIREYRRALEGMQGFFASLRPELLFTQWGGEPGDLEMEGWKAQARSNLEVASRYLGAKLVTTALLESFALSTGGDAPYSLFMGAVGDPPERKLETLLPRDGRAVREVDGDRAIDDKVAGLLESGRSTDSSFDLTNSPVSAWIHQRTSSREMAIQLDRAKSLFAGSLSPADYLGGWGGEIVSPLASALARQVPTRSEVLRNWV